jgi:hypothetical protein
MGFAVDRNKIDETVLRAGCNVKCSSHSFSSFGDDTCEWMYIAATFCCQFVYLRHFRPLGVYSIEWWGE